MGQMLLPLFSSEFNPITDLVSYEKKDGWIYYFIGQLPLYSHAESDLDSFRLFTSELVINGHVKQVDISRSFGVSEISVKRNVKRLRKEGPKNFFSDRKGKTSHVLTPSVLSSIQEFLDQGKSVSEISKRMDLKVNTLNKAIKQGKLRKKKV